MALAMDAAWTSRGVPAILALLGCPAETLHQASSVVLSPLDTLVMELLAVMSMSA